MKVAAEHTKRYQTAVQVTQQDVLIIISGEIHTGTTIKHQWRLVCFYQPVHVLVGCQAELRSVQHVRCTGQP